MGQTEKGGSQVTHQVVAGGLSGGLSGNVSVEVITEHIMQFFAYEHLPPVAQEVSKPFCELANKIVTELPRNPERTVALRKLLEAKDAAVRARIAK